MMAQKERQLFLLLRFPKRDSGLTVVGSADEREELLLVFTHLDPSDHQREFQLGVHVGPDNRYTGELIYYQTGISIHACKGRPLKHS